MPRMPALTPREVIKLLEERGFVLDRVRAAITSITSQKRVGVQSCRYINEICHVEHCYQF